MKEKQTAKLLGPKNKMQLMIFIVLVAVIFPGESFSETYGIKDSQGNFIPKATVTVGNKDVVIKKVDPHDKFNSFSITLNPKNQKLVRNVGLIELEWIDANNQPSKAVPFAGPLYNPSTRVFQDSLKKSLGLRLTDKTTSKNVFGEKPVSDLFSIHVDDQLLVTSESVAEKDRTVQLGAGRDVSLNIDKNLIVFNENNLKKGEILNVDNRTGLDQILGVELPEKGLVYYQVIRKPEQIKIPRENWEKFTVAADSGIFIVLIPEPDPSQYALLEGKDITIKVFQGNKVRETRKIPIKIASDLRTGKPPRGEIGALEGPERRTESMPPRGVESPEVSPAAPRQPAAEASEATRRSENRASTWLWVIQIFNLLLVAGMAAFGIFFMLPKIQVLQDRLAKTEMFIHGNREAIREELEQIKEEILQQGQRESSSE